MKTVDKTVIAQFDECVTRHVGTLQRKHVVESLGNLFDRLSELVRYLQSDVSSHSITGLIGLFAALGLHRKLGDEQLYNDILRLTAMLHLSHALDRDVLLRHIEAVQRCLFYCRSEAHGLPSPGVGSLQLSPAVDQGRLCLIVDALSQSIDLVGGGSLRENERSIVDAYIAAIGDRDV
jgi:hypothetical protein